MKHIPIQNQQGVWVLQDDTHISKWVGEHQRLDFDTHFLNRIISYIQPGDTIVNVGAFIGDHAIAYAKATGPTGRVYAFEPHREAFTCLALNCGKHSNIICYNHALGEDWGDASIEVLDNAGASFLKEGLGILIKPLDDIILPSLELLVMDCEGCEVEVLIGGMLTIQKHRPVIVLEVNEGALERRNQTPDELYALLEHLGYTLENKQDGPQYDLFCLPQGGRTK